MSEYKRFVSYIYAYTKDGKENNVGFAKVEIRAGKKRISITMRGIHTVPVVHVCGFYRNENRLVCVPLGRMILTGGLGQFQYGMDGEWIPGSRVRFEELAGIVISASDSSGETYATVWDDEPFQLSMFAGEEEGKEDSLATEWQEEKKESDSQEKEETDSSRVVLNPLVEETQTENKEGENILHSAGIEEEEPEEEEQKEDSEFWKKMCRIIHKSHHFPMRTIWNV